jgi:hypothetical protein
MPTDSAPDKKRARRRRVAIAAAAIVVAVIVALISGVPQRVALEYGLERALGTEVRVQHLSLVPRVRIGELLVAGDTSAAPVSLRGVDLAYALNLESVVTISSIDIDSVKLDLRQDADGSSNYQFVERLLEPKPPEAAEEPMDIAAYVPKTFRIADLSLAIESPRGALQLEGLQVEAELESLLMMSARLHGDDVRGAITGGGFGEERPVQGTVDIEVLRNMASTGAAFAVALDNIAELDGTLNVITALGSTAAEIRVGDGQFLDDSWSALLPVEIRFTSLDLSGTEIALSSPPGVPWDITADIHLDGQGVQFGESGHEWYDGDVQISGTYDGEQGDFDAMLNNGQRLTVLATGKAKNGHVAATLIDWERADLLDALPKDLRPLLDELPHLSQIGASAEVRMQWPDYEIHAAIDPLFTPEAGDAEKFALNLKGRGTAGETDQNLFRGDLTATLGEGKLTASVEAATPERYAVEVGLNSVDTTRWLTPVKQRIPVPPPPGLVDGSLILRVSPALEVKANLTLRHSGSDLTVTLTGTAEGVGTGSVFPLAGEAVLGFPNAEPPGTAELQFRISEADEWFIKSSLSKVDLASATSLVKPDLLPEGLEAVLSGRADYTRSTEAGSIHLNLDAAPATLVGIVVPTDQPLHIESSLTGPATMTGLRSKNLALRLTDDAALDIVDFAVEFEPFSVRGRVTGKVDFDYVGPVIGFPSVVGALTMDAPFVYDSNVVEGAMRFEGDGFGYGKWAGPYGTPVVLSGRTRYSVDTQSAVVDDVDVTWGEGSHLTSTQATVSLDPFSLSGPYHVTTDLAPLVDLRFLDDADGNATATGALAIGTEQPTEIQYELAARSLILSGAVVAFGGLSSSGNLAYGDSLNGTIQFAAADAATAGAVLNDPRGVCTIQDGVAEAAGVEATLYGGRTTFNASVNVLDMGEGGRLDAHLQGVDLDRFTKEYEPPAVVLTGIADGDISLAWNEDGVKDLRVDLASEEDFSMNREVIENLLLQSVTAEVTGLKRLNRRIREDTIGEAAQRPFERAAMSLSLEGETYDEQRLTGPVSLKSEMLDLSIDLGVDLRAIASAMELQQQAQLGEGDTLSAEPVQWSLPGESPNP